MSGAHHRPRNLVDLAVRESSFLKVFATTVRFGWTARAFGMSRRTRASRVPHAVLPSSTISSTSAVDDGVYVPQIAHAQWHAS